MFQTWVASCCAHTATSAHVAQLHLIDACRHPALTSASAYEYYKDVNDVNGLKGTVYHSSHLLVALLQLALAPVDSSRWCCLASCSCSAVHSSPMRMKRNVVIITPDSRIKVREQPGDCWMHHEACHCFTNSCCSTSVSPQRSKHIALALSLN